MKKALLLITPFMVLFTLTACNTMGDETGEGTDRSSSSVSSSVDASAASSVTVTAYVGRGCKVGGCSSQLCVSESDPDVVSTCEYTAAYACFQTARCEQQDGGECGWSRTDALVACLNAARS